MESIEVLKLTLNINRGLAACISSGLSVEETARACVESKVDIIVVQHQASLRNILAIQHRYLYYSSILDEVIIQANVVL